MKVSLIASVVALSATVALSVVAAPDGAPATRPVAVAVAPVPQLSKAQTDFFEARVRPLLSARCYKCHSVAEGKAKGGLVLDTREGLQKGGENGVAIVPGDVDKSRLIKAISYTDPDLQMPPKGDKLSATEIADLTTWVKMGAPDPRVSAPGGAKLTGLNDKARAHWAYQPVKHPQVPSVQNTAWVKTPVDAFILNKLDQNAMKPNVPAPRESLIRRATYDLIGLPPTPEEVRAFVNDTSPNAFEKVIDRLLASPHYGERWGRFWLDSARYSDTTGVDQVRRDDYRYAHAWTYRDYVIKSFNDDKPYDRFLMEQIAADQLPGADKDPSRLAALGFITVGKRFQNPNDTIDERIDTLCKSTMALTVACARCHDHKFDPIPTADYYSLHGIFASTIEPDEKPIIGMPRSAADYADFKKQLAELEQKDRETYFDILDTKSTEFREKAADYLLVLAYGRKAPAETVIARNKLISEHHLDKDIYQGGLRGIKKDDTVLFPFIQFAAIPPDQFEQRAKDLMRKIASGEVGPRRHVNPLVAAAFRKVAPESIHSIRDVAEIYGKLFAEIDPKAKAYIKACRTATGASVPGFDDDLIEVISVPAPVEVASVLTTEKLRELAPRLPVVNQGAYNKFLFAQINELELTHPGAPAKAMVVADAPHPHDSPIFIRGEAQNRGPIAPRQFLEILSGKNRKPFTHGSGRLELAQAIANRNNPLTARVMVNRIWMHHFGEGFVRTVDDLGVQSEPPSHPELLDYLASRFMDDGWSVKRMHKLIMMSSVYQQSSETNPSYALRDPSNRLLWRANLRRLDFEAVRDTMLQFTGKIDLTIGGKPVNLTDEPYSNRRSVYGYVDRGDLPELMAQFDFSDPDMANSRRTSTIVPQQALFFMNSPMSADVARKVTQRPEFLAAKDDPARVRALYEVLYQRMPHPQEIRLALDFMHNAQGDESQVASGKLPAADPSNNPNLARRMAIKNGLRKLNGRAAIRNEGEMVARKPLTPWERYAQALLFTNEVSYVN